MKAKPMIHTLVVSMLLIGFAAQAFAARDKCFATEQQMQKAIKADKSGRLRSILGSGKQYFNTWKTGFMDLGKIRVESDGQAVLTAPNEKPIHFTVELCVGGDSNRPYVVVLGNKVYFDNKDSTKITLEHPKKPGEFHTFVSGVQ